MNTLPTVILKPRNADRVLAGHPWIYAAAVARLTAPAQSGALVQVKDHRQRFLGVGFYNEQSKIRVRMIATERIQVDEAFFQQRIRTALEHRRRHLPSATSFRVVNAESDLLSGLIVDKYEDVLVMQISSLAMEQRKGLIRAALEEIFHPGAILERADQAQRKFEGIQDTIDDPSAPQSRSATVQLNGLQFETDLHTGHKTGLYLDQQENYRLVAELVATQPNARVLDCFSFLGGFAIHCARAGAQEVLGIDQSAEAVARAKANAESNGVAEQCSFEAANVFDWLKVKTQTEADDAPRASYDAVILDPPSFTRSRANIPQALRGYKEIHLRALKLLKVGGVLATFCCSHHVDANLFLETILAAAYDARRWLRRVAIYHQSPDHPVLPAVPETEYLKGYAFEVIR